MDPAASFVRSDPPEPVFEDGLGQRVWRPDEAGERGAHVLTLRGSFATVPSFEFALRERTARLAAFRHAGYARVRSVERRSGAEPTLSVVSDAAPGTRLSDLLDGLRTRSVALDIHASLCLIRQLVTSAAILRDSVQDATHGALAPERLVLTPQANLLVVEYSLGSALEQLRYSPERYWSELRIPLPSSATAPRFDDRADVLQIGIVALSLIRGRKIQCEEFPANIADVVAATWAVSADGGFEPLPPGLRGWLRRALQLDADRSFMSAVEARTALDVILGPGELLASPSSLEAFLARYQAAAPDAGVAKPAARAASPSSVRIEHPADQVVVIAAPWRLEHHHAAAKVARHWRPPTHLVPLPDTAGSPHLAAREWSGVKRLGAMAAIAGTVGLMAAGGRVAALVSAAYATRPASGTLELASNPVGAEAYVNGQLRGKTPLVLVLDAGSYSVELRGSGQRRTVPVTIKPGTRVSQFVQLPRRRPTTSP